METTHKKKEVTRQEVTELKDIIQDLKISFEDLRIGLDALWDWIEHNHF